MAILACSAVIIRADAARVMDIVDQTCSVDDGTCTVMKCPNSATGYIETDYGERQLVPDDKTMKWVRRMDHYMHEHVFVDEKYQRIRHQCTNNNEDCSFWAARGECRVNPQYMKVGMH